VRLPRVSPAARRRRAALIAAALLALAAGLAVGAGGDGDGPERAPGPAGGAPASAPARAQPAAPPADLARLAGRVIVMRVVGPTLPAYAGRALRAGRAAGLVLFGDNVEDPAQLRRLTRAVQRAAGGRAIVAVDQEGGAVRNVPWAGPEAGAPVQADPETETREAGEALRALGITVTLAPVADLPSPALGARAYAAEPELAAARVAQAVRGWRAGGVAPTAKHFPGLGGASANTDDAPVTLPGEPELRPFAAAIAAGVPLVMASHAAYPALDPRRIASQSRPILDGLLRGRLGFRGAVVTDSLEAAAALATGSLERVAERSLRAGADLLLTTGQGSYLRIHRRLVAVARRDPALRARLREAAARVERVR